MQSCRDPPALSVARFPGFSILFLISHCCYLRDAAILSIEIACTNGHGGTGPADQEGALMCRHWARWHSLSAAGRLPGSQPRQQHLPRWTDANGQVHSCGSPPICSNCNPAVCGSRYFCLVKDQSGKLSVAPCRLCPLMYCCV